MRVRQAMPAAIAIFLVVAFVLVPQEGRPQTSSRSAPVRTIEFTTTQVTQPEVTLSPDDQWLIVTMLGHLFRLPVAGGAAEQLTFGPSYDADPVFSPDGARIAFTSDRDGREGNIFVLELESKRIAQVTHEAWAGRPTWTPDGQAIVYLAYVPLFQTVSLVRRIALSGGEPQTLSTPPRQFRTVFYLPDGRLVWTVVERQQGPSRLTTRFEVVSPQGSVSALRTIEGEVDRVVSSPAGDGLYCRRLLTPQNSGRLYDADLLFLPLSGGPERLVTVVPHEPVRFAVATDGKSLYLGEAGSLWKIALTSLAREPIAFKARVRLEIQGTVTPPKTAYGAPRLPVVRTVTSPRLSPDGRTLVFGALGYLWQQPLNGGPARRLFEGSAFEDWPAYSPDGRQLAFVRSEHGKDEIRILDLENRQTRTVASGLGQPSWSPDGQRLVFRAGEQSESFRVVSVSLSDGKSEQLAETGLWSPRPQFSADGRWLYFSANTSGTGTLYRQALEEKAKPEPVTQLARHLSDGVVSPDGKWLVFRRNREIWAAALGTEPVQEKDVRQLNPQGGDSFAFTPDSAGVIYAVGNRVWRQKLANGEREEIPIRLAVTASTPPPLLLRRVRVLDFDAGGFGPETTVFVEQGRIRWMGSERGHTLPRETVTLDAGGRFAIPGLFDMHVHLDRWWHSVGADHKAFLAYGVTSVREVGGEPNWTKALSERSEATSDPVPRYYFAGELIEGTKSVGGDLSLLIADENDARTSVRALKDEGVHFLKAYSTLPWPLHRVVAEEARRLGLQVIGHGLTVEEVTKSVTLGYATLEHLPWPNPYYDDVLQLLAASGTRWDPTLAIVGGNRVLLRDEPEQWTEAKFRAFGSRDWVEQGNLCGLSNSLRGSWAQWLGSVTAAHRLGVGLLAGTDAAHPCVFYGSALQWELEHFVHAGLKPIEVLRMATEEAAHTLGAEDLGTLAAGKLADLVLLDSNPLENIRNTQLIWRVIKGGWLFDPDTLRPPATSRTPGQP